MVVTCKFCGGPHPWFDCRKKPEGWKPNAPQARKAEDSSGRLPNVQAVEVAWVSPAQRGEREVQRPQEAPKRRGRPSTGFDKADYNRRFMKAKRAKEKAEAH